MMYQFKQPGGPVCWSNGVGLQFAFAGIVFCLLLLAGTFFFLTYALAGTVPETYPQGETD